MSIADSVLPGFTHAAAVKFMAKSSATIRALNARMKKKGFSGNLPLAVGRQAMVDAIQKPCRYCGEVVKISTVSLDHPTPLARGGAPFVVVGCCLSCNQKKGELTAKEYLGLRAFVGAMSPEAQEYIWRAISAAGFFWKMQAQANGMRLRNKQLAAGGKPPERKRKEDAQNTLGYA